MVDMEILTKIWPAELADVRLCLVPLYYKRFSSGETLDNIICYTPVNSPSHTADGWTGRDIVMKRLREVGLARGSRHVRHQAVHDKVAARVKRCSCVKKFSELVSAGPVPPQARVDLEVNSASPDPRNGLELRGC
jgi:hypothetical protein